MSEKLGLVACLNSLGRKKKIYMFSRAPFFCRDHINKGKKGNTFAESLIRQRIAELMQVILFDPRT